MCYMESIYKLKNRILNLKIFTPLLVEVGKVALLCGALYSLTCDKKIVGGISYTAHGAQIPPPLFFCFNVYFRLG